MQSKPATIALRDDQAMDRDAAIDQLANLLRERGYFRVPDEGKRRKALARARKHGKKPTYKKGWETRFVAGTPADARHIQALIRKAGFSAGASYLKHNQRIIPLYGKAATLQLQERLRARASQ